MYEESLCIRRKVFGDEHPDVAQSLHNLAALLNDQVGLAEHVAERSTAEFYSLKGQLGNAKTLYEEGIAIWQKVHGDEHPLVAAGLNNLARLLSSQVGFYVHPLLRFIVFVALTPH